MWLKKFAFQIQIPHSDPHYLFLHDWPLECMFFQLFYGRVRDLLDILRACVRSRPTLLGSTVWGLTDIHRVLCPVALTQKDKPQPLYLVKVGV